MGEQKDRMLRGELYLADDPELAADHRRCRLLVERFNATSVTEHRQRVELLRTLLGHLGEDTEIKPPLQCDYGYPISVGARSFVNYGAVILDCAPVSIGDDVQIATAVQLLTATHPLDPAVRRSRYESAEPISIADGVWLGAGVIVCPGVSIGRDTVVGAGSVVTRDLPAGVLAVGNPCRVVRELQPGPTT
jgi:maltose O-acetyltransferase